MIPKPLPAPIERGFVALREAARTLRSLESQRKNAALEVLADRVWSERARILSANAEDLARLPADTPSHFRDRLLLNDERIRQMATSLKAVAALPDPIGEIVDERTTPNGLRLKRVRSPLGVIFMIFESRPNVVLEAFSLAFKSSNAIALRGGSESAATAGVLYALMRDSLAASHVDPSSFFGITDYDRTIVASLLTRKDWIDVVVPRGGDRLIDFVTKTSEIPVIKNDRGLCHAYIAEDADLDMAVRVVTNAKMQRPGVCNSLETVLVNAGVAPIFLPQLLQATVGVQWRADEATRQIVPATSRVRAAEESDWDTEHLDMILNCRVVKNLEEALAHIEKHGSRHSETILTSDETKARRFQNEVDAAAVYWNASTRFTDGFEFGLGGELGISTQKLHVRGPVGLRELTSVRWVIDGTGQTRS